MKKNKTQKIKFSLVGFLLFFLTIGFTSTISVIVFSYVNKQTNGNIAIIIISVLATIMLGAVICTLFDIIRRKNMVERPVDMILQATEKISKGDFKVKLIPQHSYDKYDEYDLIFENINILTAELSKNEILKNDFISNVSHEIKTPLAVIQNLAKSLKTDDLSNQKKQEYLDGLILQTNKLSSLISNILKLNKLENQKIVPENKEFDLAEQLRVVTLSYENLFDKKGLNLVCDIDEMTINNTESLLEIVFNNLISNAIKFTDIGGTITISLKQDGEYAIIKIADTGCGISSETGKHIFDKFYQGDTSHSSEGNGLGLALVKKVIDIIGGEIKIESVVGKGTTFTIKLQKDNA